MTRLYYHCASPNDRRSIAEHGLDHRRAGAVDWREHDPEKSALAPRGNYLWAELDIAKSLAIENQCDLWVVSLPSSAAAPDPWGERSETFEDAVIVQDPIPPDCLALGIAGLTPEQINERRNLARAIDHRSTYERGPVFRLKRAVGLERSHLAELEDVYESKPRLEANQQVLSGSGLAPQLSRLDESPPRAEAVLAQELALD